MDEMNPAAGKVIGVTSAFVCFAHYLGFPCIGYSHGSIHEQIAEVTLEIRKDSSDALLYLKRGELLRYDRDWQAALSDLDRAASLDPALDLVALARGKVLYEGGWYDRSKSVLDQFLVRNSNHLDALITRARVLRHLGQNLAAAVDYTQALASMTDPRPEHYIERAQALIPEGVEYWPTVIAGLDEGIAVLGNIVTLQLMAIDLEVKLKSYDQALHRLTALADQSPRKEKWLYRRGEILSAAGRLLEARSSLSQALKNIEELPAQKRKMKTTQNLESEIRSALGRVERRIHLEANHGAS